MTLDAAAHERMIARFDRETIRPEWVAGCASGIVLRGTAARLEAAKAGLGCFDRYLQGPDAVFCDA